RRREISSGKAAGLLGMERFEFVRYAARLGIPFFDMDETELAGEVRQAETVARVSIYRGGFSPAF
ncbi:MAG: UPF0175 family protein, partial [Anaerolineae bacterium]